MPPPKVASKKRFKTAIDEIMERTKQRKRERLKQKIQDRWPQLHDHQVPVWYKKCFLSQDKVILPGQGKNWIWKTLTAETTDLIYTFKSWDRLHAPYRNVRLVTPMSMLRSDVNRRLLFPDLFSVLCISSLFCFYNANVVSMGTIIPGLHGAREFLLHSNMLCLPVEPFLTVGTFIGLIVTFRTNTSYARYRDARDMWSRTVANCREICSRVLVRIPMQRGLHGSNDEKILAARVHGAKLAQTFPHALKYHITADGCNLDLFAEHETDVSEINRQKRQHLREELELIWDFSESEERMIAESILDDSVTNWPLHVCHELSRINATLYSAPNAGGLAPPNAEGLDSRIAALQQIVTDCEKVLQTPIYTSYTNFTSRMIFLWACTLPTALYPLIGPVATPLATVAISWVYFGIDDIGRRVEIPFKHRPLWQYCADVDHTCELYINMALERDGEPENH